MLSEAIKERLRDPDYLDLHMAAIASLVEVGRVGWYDSNFLRRLEVAKLFLGKVAPKSLPTLEEGFVDMKPVEGFTPPVLDDLFDDKVRARLRAITNEEPDEKQKSYETEGFGRLVVHDHSYLTELQNELTSRVSQLAGVSLTPAYNFLSLYGGTGKCGMHLDEPQSMFTLDYCIDQSDEWPIYFSKIVEWPTINEMRNWSPDELKEDPALGWQPFVLKPNQALLFAGSSQWHYRNPIKPGGWCNLLFFHYYPTACGDLVRPHLWAKSLNIPELQPLCDLFSEEDRPT